MTNFEEFCQIPMSFLSIYSSKEGSGSVIEYFQGSGSGSETLDFPREKPDPKLIISDPEN